MVSETVNFDRHRIRRAILYSADVTFATADLTTGGTNSGVLDVGGMSKLTFYYIYTGDTAVTLELFEDPDGPDFSDGNVAEWQLGNDINLTDGSSTTEFERDTLTDFARYIRPFVSADSSNATSGQLVVKVRGIGD